MPQTLVLDTCAAETVVDAVDELRAFAIDEVEPPALEPTTVGATVCPAGADDELAGECAACVAAAETDVAEGPDGDEPEP